MQFAAFFDAAETQGDPQRAIDIIEVCRCCIVLYCIGLTQSQDLQIIPLDGSVGNSDAVFESLDDNVGYRHTHTHTHTRPQVKHVVPKAVLAAMQSLQQLYNAVCYGACP